MRALFGVRIKQLIGRAMAAIEPLTPPQYVYALHTRDLRNVTPTNLLFDNRGNRLAGRFASTDITHGTPSPVIWAYFVPIALLSAIAAVLLMLAAIFGAWIPIKAYSAAYMAQGGGMAGAALGALGSTYAGMLQITAVAMVPAWLMCYFAYLVVAETEPTRMAHHVYWGALAIVSGIAILIPVLGPAVAALLALACPWLLYWLRLQAMEYARHNALRAASDDAKALTGLPDADVRERQRELQAERALKDVLPDGRPAPLMVLGVDTGWIRTETGNTLSTDKGAVAGISLGEDLSTHVFAFGSTGSGKTSGLHQRVARAWASNRMGGMLVMDAKAGSLPIELHKAGVIDHLVWPARGARINLLGSMSSMEVGDALEKVFSDHEGADKFWGRAARLYIGCALLLVRLAGSRGVDGVQVNWRCLTRFCTDDAERTRILEVLASEHADALRARTALAEAHHQWGTLYPTLPEATLGSLRFTLETWLKEITTNDAIGEQLCAGAEDGGLDIAEMVCRGARVGIVLSEKDGYAGRLALTLIKTATYSRIKARAQNPQWRQQGEVDVLVQVDECSPVVEKLDEEAASQLRSLGARLCFATQSYDQLIKRLGGEREANAFLDNFKTIGTFSASGAGEHGMAGTYAYISSRLGSVYRLDSDDSDIEAVALDKAVSKSRASGLENRRLGGIADGVSSIATAVAELRRALSLNPFLLDDEKDRMRQDASDSYTLRLMPAATPQEMSYLLNGTHRFVGVLQRGGVGRVVTLDTTPGVEDEVDKRIVAFFESRIELQRVRRLAAPTPGMRLGEGQREFARAERGH